jgi:hypothetical protein
VLHSAAGGPLQAEVTPRLETDSSWVRRVWRDRRLAALAKLKRDLDREEAADQ